MTNNNTNESKANQLGGKPVRKSNVVMSKAELAKANSRQLEETNRVRREMVAAAAAELDRISSPGAMTTNVRAEKKEPTKSQVTEAVEPAKRQVAATVESEKKVKDKESVDAKSSKTSQKKKKKELEPLEGENKSVAIGSLKFAFSLLINSVIVLLLIQVFILSYQFGYKLFGNTSYNASDKSEISVVILPDSSSLEIVETLEDSGVIDNRWVMLCRIKLGKYSSELMPGTYILSPSMTTDEIIDTLCGKVSEDSK